MSRKIALLMIVIVVASAVLGTILRPTPTGPAGAASAPATPTPAPAPASVVSAITAVEGAFNAGDVKRICRSSALLDRAVLRELNAQSGGCVAEAESLVNAAAPLQLAVIGAQVRPGLATARVTLGGGARVDVDLLPRAGGWLLSFSGDGDPLSALAGA
jgi:hypothetical protein